MAGAPLLPFLRRFSQIERTPSIFFDSVANTTSCTQTYLDFLELPSDDSLEIDLKQAAGFVMAHLDRLACDHIPPLSFNKVKIILK